MHTDHRKRRMPVINRGRRVPNLYRRPKPPRIAAKVTPSRSSIATRPASSGRRRSQARTIQRAIVEAEEYRTQLRRGEVLPPSRLTFARGREEYFEIIEALVATGERSQRTLDLYRQRYRTHIEPSLGRKRVQDIRAEHIGAIFARQRERASPRGRSPGRRRSSRRSSASLSRAATSRESARPALKDRKASAGRTAGATAAERPRDTGALRRRNTELRPIVTTLAWTGLRVSEALAFAGRTSTSTTRNPRPAPTRREGSTQAAEDQAGTRTIPLLPIARTGAPAPPQGATRLRSRGSRPADLHHSDRQAARPAQRPQPGHRSRPRKRDST